MLEKAQSALNYPRENFDGSTSAKATRVAQRLVTEGGKISRFGPWSARHCGNDRRGRDIALRQLGLRRSTSARGQMRIWSSFLLLSEALTGVDSGITSGA